MKRVLRRVIPALVMAFLCLGMCAPAASAAEIAVKIPVTIRMEGEVLPESDTVSATLKALDGAPMPAGTVDGTAGLEIACRDRETKAGFDIVYDTLGIYEYILTIHGGSHALAEYGDDSVYYVTVSVVNDENGGFTAYVAMHTDPEGKSPKYDSAEDTNRYYAPKTLRVVKKWVDKESSARPNSIKVELLADGEVMEGSTLTITAQDGWKGEWSGLDSRAAYTVRETKVTGYTASYRYDRASGTWIITNTSSLLQTGQLNWPIPVLTVSGLLLIAAGVILAAERRKNHDV